MPLIIKPDGLFHGERLHRCSPTARLWWPHFFIASNACARLRLHYPDFLRTVFDGFAAPPSAEQVAAMFEEYRRNYLVFLYRTESGEVWGQWDTETNSYLRFNKEASRTSPAPPQPAFDNWRAEYREQKSRTTAGLFDRLPLSRGDAPSVAESHGEAQSDAATHGDAPPKERRGEFRRGEFRRVKQQGAFAPPEWVHRQSWDAFEEMRLRLRKPLTDHARRLLVGKLEKLRDAGDDARLVIEQSVENSWKGFFPLRQESASPTARHGSPAPARGTSRDASDIIQQRQRQTTQNAGKA